MAKKKKSVKKIEASCESKKNCGCGGCFYGLGFVGSAVYYLSTATGFWNGVLGLLKAAVWPAFLIFESLKFLAA